MRHSIRHLLLRCLIAVLIVGLLASGGFLEEQPSGAVVAMPWKVSQLDTPTGTPTAMRPQTSALSLPDLTIAAMQITLESGGACNYTSTNLGLRVYMRNIGASAAGPFTVEANGNSKLVADGLPTGEMTSLWFEGYLYPGINTATVDSTNQVPESDETNNTRAEFVPIPTLPPTCTPTPTGTVSTTPTPTSTPTQIPTHPEGHRIYIPFIH